MTCFTSTTNVLIVDDDSYHLASVRRVLKRSGIDVETANSGSQALQMLDGWLPELLVIDVSMPCMSGQEFLRRFRRYETRVNIERGQPAAPPVPAVFLSGRTDLAHRVAGLDAGACDYLLKPIEAQELRARVRSHLRQARRVRESFDLAQALESFEMELQPGGDV